VPTLPAIATGAIAFALSLLLTWIAIRAGIRFGIADVPGGRRKHARVTSRLGALPLFGAFTLAALLSRLFGVTSLDPQEPARFLAFMAGGCIVFALALLDDKFNLPPRWQFALQIGAAFIAIAGQVYIERFTNPFTRELVILPAALGPVLGSLVVVALTLFWFLGMMNTVNFLDGVDGLASSVALIAAGVVAIHMLREGQYSVALLPIALIGTLLGFLVFNFPPAKIFLGGGALYLGYTLACVGIIGGAKIALLLLVMGLPIADVLWQMIDRLRHGRNPASSDRGHLHLRLADQGWPAIRIVALYATACILFGGAALLPMPPLAKLITLAGLFVLVILGMMRLPGPQHATPAEHAAAPHSDG
jgi:UDP-GlcNAc:undecaprenyl-phosphate GlcNAc-1-phosphate transferase